jgi:hypothetical protein
MSSDAGDASGNGASGTESGNSELAALIDAKVNEVFNKALGPRIERALGAKLPALLEAQIKPLTEALKVGASSGKPEGGDGAAAPEGSAQGERLSLKALQTQFDERYKALQHKLEASERQRTEAEAKAQAAKLGAEVRSLMGQHLEAHMVDPLFTHFGERFGTDENGQTVVKFRRDWGEEPLPLDKGFDELLKTDLKPYLPARNANLPPAHIRPPGPGQPYQPPRPGQGPYNPLLERIADAQSKERPHVAQALRDAAHSKPTAR